jgi:hypothetical protein
MPERHAFESGGRALFLQLPDLADHPRALDQRIALGDLAGNHASPQKAD